MAEQSNQKTTQTFRVNLNWSPALNSLNKNWGIVLVFVFLNYLCLFTLSNGGALYTLSSNDTWEKAHRFLVGWDTKLLQAILALLGFGFAVGLVLARGIKICVKSIGKGFLGLVAVCLILLGIDLAASFAIVLAAKPPSEEMGLSLLGFFLAGFGFFRVFLVAYFSTLIPHLLSGGSFSLKSIVLHGGNGSVELTMTVGAFGFSALAFAVIFIVSAALAAPIEFRSFFRDLLFFTPFIFMHVALVAFGAASYFERERNPQKQEKAAKLALKFARVLDNVLR